MTYLEYEVENFLLDSSFRSYCLGTNEENVAFWEQWIMLHPEKYELVKEARQLYLLLNGNVGSNDISHGFEEFRLRFESHVDLGNTTRIDVAPVISIASADPASRFKRTGSKRYWLGAAAAIAFVVATAAIWEHMPSASAPSPALSAGNAMVSKAGELKNFKLPDGTKVTLNAGSTLQISGDFNETKREITLVGEAFFEVAKNPKKVFLIHTSLIDIKVLGTSFNVKAYKGERESETSLLTGSVEVKLRSNNSAILLRPGEKIVVPDNTLLAKDKTGPPGSTPAPVDGYRVERISVDASDSSFSDLSWTRNKLVFNDDSFSDIATALERYYGISIIFEDADVKAYRFTASFEKKSIGQVLAALAASRPFKYRQEPENRIIISRSNMKN